MGLFSRLLNGSNEGKIKEESTAFKDIVDKLNEDKKTNDIANRLQNLYADKNTTKEDYIVVLNKLKAVLDAETQKSDFKAEISSLKQSFEAIKNKEFNNEVKDFENYLDDFHCLGLDISVLKKLDEIFKAIYDNENLNQLYLDYKVLYKSFENIKSESENLIQEEEVFSKEVMKFANTISELEQKYRLSIDWEGKKPIMINYRKKLVEKRQNLVAKEESLNKKIEVIYITYNVLKSKFIKEGDYITSFLKNEQTFFSSDSGNLVFLKESYQKLDEFVKKTL